MYDITKLDRSMINELSEKVRNKEPEQTIYVCTMGGDGTLSSLLDRIVIWDEYLKKNLNRLYFVPLPYGTGNDLSNSLGWGDSEGSWGKSIEILMVTIILKGKKDKLSLWEISIFTDELYQISGKNKDMVFSHDEEIMKNKK